MQAYDSARHHRRSIRLKGYDYTLAGAYFVTFCVQSRENLFGEIVEGQMLLNDAGRMIETVWQELSVFYPGVDTDAFVVMPNHFHGIVVLTPDMGQPQGVAPTSGVAPTASESVSAMSLPNVVHRFKTMTTKRYTDGVKGQAWTPYAGRLWQRNYYEHIVRNEEALDSIRVYIDDNPRQWDKDIENTNK